MCTVYYRLSPSEFKYSLGNMNFFGNIICPVLYVDVTVFPDEARSEVVVSRAETVGSPVADKINGTFSISAVNSVRAGVDGKGRKTLQSKTDLSVDVLLPTTKIPLGIIKSTGNFIMQNTLNLVVPTFVRILAKDFSRWSAGDDNRNAVDGAQLSV
jgi:Protein of unknown function (DUF1997)